MREFLMILIIFGVCAACLAAYIFVKLKKQRKVILDAGSYNLFQLKSIVAREKIPQINYCNGVYFV